MKTSVYHIILLIFLNSFLFAQEIDIDSVARFYRKAQDKNILDAQTKREFNAISKYLEKDEYYFYRNIISNIEATFRNDYERSYVILNDLRIEKQKSKIHQAATLFEIGAFFEKIHYHDYE